MSAFHINNSRDLRFAHQFIRDYEAGRYGFSCTLDDLIAEQKREIRRYNREDHEDQYVLDDHYDSFIGVDILPEVICTIEEAEAWWQANRYREYEPSPYDCTGQITTGRHKMRVRSDGRIVIYTQHYVDV